MHKPLYQAPNDSKQLLSYSPCRPGQIVVVPTGCGSDYQCLIWDGQYWSLSTDSCLSELAIWTYIRMANDLERPCLVRQLFFVEQLANFAANYAYSAAKLVGLRFTTPNEAALMFMNSAVVKVYSLLRQPLEHAVAQLQRDGLYPNHADAIVAQRIIVEWAHTHSSNEPHPTYLTKVFAHSLVSALSASLLMNFPNINEDRFKAIHAASLAIEGLLKLPVSAVLAGLHASNQYPKNLNTTVVKRQLVEWVQTLGRENATPILVIDAVREELKSTRSHLVENHTRLDSENSIHMSWLAPQAMLETKSDDEMSGLPRAFSSLCAFFSKTGTER